MQLFLRSAYLSSLLSVIYIALLYRCHPSRRLPMPAVLSTFVVGMLSVVPAVLLYRFIPSSAMDHLLGAVVIAPLVEEAVKLGLFALTARRLGYPNLIEPIDYAILFGILGVGFGIYEDFWYIFGTSYPSWISGDDGRFLEVFRWMLYARSFPGHVLFNGLAGFAIGWGLIEGQPGRRWRWVAGGFAIAVGCHALFNLVASRGGTLLLWSLVLLYGGAFLVLRRRMTERSPFTALPTFIQGKTGEWTYSINPVDVLFADGFGWPGRTSRSFLSFYPLALSLVILFPVFMSCVYFLHRLMLLGWRP